MNYRINNVVILKKEVKKTYELVFKRFMLKHIYCVDKQVVNISYSQIVRRGNNRRKHGLQLTTKKLVVIQW